VTAADRLPTGTGATGDADPAVAPGVERPRPGLSDRVLVGAPAGSRRRLVLGAAAVTVAAAVAGQVGALPTIPLGGLELSFSLVPALALGVACGNRLLGRSTARHAAIGYWVAMAITLPTLAVIFARTGRLDLWVALVVAATQEELVYRLAAPAVFALVLRAMGMVPGRARVVGLVLAGIWFVLLPGHLEQMTGPTTVAPYLAFAALAAIIVHRSGSILPVAAGHAVANMVTILMWDETVASDQRGMWLACTLGLLLLAYGRPRRLTLDDQGGLVDTHTGQPVAVIDLCDPASPHAVLADGTRVPVDVRDAGTHTATHRR
jgi:hypothetical protein